MSDVPPPQPPKRRIVIREVFEFNLISEFERIRALIDRYPIISMDTEFPGVVVRPDSNIRHRDPAANYNGLKANVDLLNLIQIGITLSDEEGNLPDFGSGSTYYIWEFNFKDFDIARHAHALDSVELLKRQGIDFEKNREFGIDSVRFAELLMSSGLVLNKDVTWVTFHSAYDFGYLVKCLTQRVLPEKLSEFLTRVGLFFGAKVYDVKHLIRFCTGLYGGLDRVCKALGVERVVGKSHQAGSDSLLTLHAFLKIKDKHFGNDYELEKATAEHVMVSFKMSFAMQRVYKLVPQTGSSGPFHRWPLFGRGPPNSKWEKEAAKKLRIKRTFLFDQTMDLVASSITDFSAN